MEQATEKQPTSVIRSAGSLRVRTLAKVADRLVKANDALSGVVKEDAKIKADAIGAWLFAFDNGFEKYRPTLALFGIVKPNGNLQKAFTVARWARLGETENALPELVKDIPLAKLADKAREELRGWGVLNERKAGRTQTTVQRCESYVRSLYQRLYKAEDTTLAPGKGAKQGGESLPFFNARALMVRYLVMGAGKAPGLGLDAVKHLAGNHETISVHIPTAADAAQAAAKMAEVGQ